MSSTYKIKCSKCGKGVDVVREISLPDRTIFIYSCGHADKRDRVTLLTVDGKATELDPFDVESLDKKHPYGFQIKGAKFAVDANLRCLIADEPGLGKTIQALIAIKTSGEWPFIVFCKSALKTQWSREIIRWMGPEFVPQTITSSNEKLLPGFRSYVISLDLLRRFNGEDKFEGQMQQVGIKAIVIDECQLIKNTDAQRTVLVRRASRQVDHILALSGTPIKNNAGEYFSILNILAPEMFNNYQRYLSSWCDWHWDGYRYVVGGLADPAYFREKTKNLIIRRTREEVLPDLPKVTRNFRFCDLGKDVEQAYLDTFVEFRDYYNRSDSERLTFQRESNILAYLSHMRHLTGISKIDPCIDFLMEFLGATDRRITVFVHHKDVGTILLNRIASLCAELGLKPPLNITSDMNADKRFSVVQDFSADGSRSLIASTQASGEGLNLQACSDCVMLERQWNPANEEQAEGRFIRIGQEASKVTGTYFVAVGTVDEFFSEIVERKRGYVSNTLDGVDYEWDESSIMKELAEVLAAKGGQRWRV